MRFEITSPLFVTDIPNAVTHHHHRNAALETNGQIIARKGQEYAPDDFTLQQGKKQHLTLLHQGKEGFVFDMMAVFGEDNGLDGVGL